MMRVYCFFLCFFFYQMIWAQPANDNCATAFVISNPSNFCSDPAAYTLAGATPSSEFGPTCWASANVDVWFVFVAVATDLNVRAIGSNGAVPGGTLRNPEIVVYEGACNSLLQKSCLSDAFGQHVVESVATKLVPGRVYYVRINSRINNQGTFQFCINNFNNVPSPASDCEAGVILCDKSAFSVSSLIGEGNDTDEVGGTCIQQEFSSAWYKWTTDQPGSLTFTLTPNNPGDDLDFAVYELPNGVDNCSNKTLRRCMASGENQGSPLSDWIRCYGPTGLREGSIDSTESPGCQGGDDNFLKPLDMKVGKSYALIVNNFSNSGSGFNITFGGTATFLGPDAEFEIVSPVEPYCRREPIMFEDRSTIRGGNIEEYEWNFGEGSSEITKSGIGPHSVIYASPGYKNVSLTLRNERGCLVTQQKRILVECCDYPVFIDVGEDQEVKLGDSIQLNVIVDLPGLTYTYVWNPESALSCNNCPDPFVLVGNNTMVTIVVTDEEGCLAQDSLTLRVNKIKNVFFPDAFTPNLDGINDKYTGFSNAAAIQFKVFRIYSRWGELIYEGFDFPLSNTREYGWDGTFKGQEMASGVYVFYAEVEFLDFEISKFSGGFTLIR